MKIKDINTEFFKKNSVKLIVGVSMIGLISFGANTVTSYNNDNNQKEVEVMDMIEEEKAIVNCNFEGITENDDRVVSFFTQEDADTVAIQSIIKANGEKHTANLEPGSYYVTSDGIEKVPLEITDTDQEFSVNVNYNERTIECSELTQNKAK